MFIKPGTLFAPVAWGGKVPMHDTFDCINQLVHRGLSREREEPQECSYRALGQGSGNPEISSVHHSETRMGRCGRKAVSLRLVGCSRNR